METEKELASKVICQRCYIGRLIWSGRLNQVIGFGDT
jgi:hypothetical protein